MNNGHAAAALIGLQASQILHGAGLLNLNAGAFGQNQLQIRMVAGLNFAAGWALAARLAVCLQLVAKQGLGQQNGLLQSLFWSAG